MPRITRRTALLGAVGVGAAAVAIPLAARVNEHSSDAHGTAAVDPAHAAPMPGRSAWAGLVGTSVAVAGRPGVTSLRLSSIGDLTDAPAGDDDRYSLVFTTPVPVEGIVSFTGLADRPVDLFLSPVTDRNRTTAEAVVSRA